MPTLLIYVKLLFSKLFRIIRQRGNIKYFTSHLLYSRDVYHLLQNDVRELKFNTSGRCQEPMVPTDSPSSYYEAMEGCGVQCDNPMFTPDERYQIHRLVAWAATICLLCNSFTVVSSLFGLLLHYFLNTILSISLLLSPMGSL